MKTEISRRDFLKSFGRAALGAAIMTSPAERLIRAASGQEQPLKSSYFTELSENWEILDSTTTEVFISPMGKHGLTVVKDNTHNTITLFAGQPREGQSADGQRTVEIVEAFSLVENAPASMILKRENNVTGNTHETHEIPSLLLFPEALVEESIESPNFQSEVNRIESELENAQRSPLDEGVAEGKAYLYIMRDPHGNVKNATIEISAVTKEGLDFARTNMALSPVNTTPGESMVSISKDARARRVTVTSTSTPESQSETEPVFVPEGFEIGERGLLRNPQTGKDVITFNKEADWEKFREEIIGGLWQANVDWASFTGEKSDALNYKTKEEFIKAAKEGQTFKIGIPVRSNMYEETISFGGISNKPVGIRLEMVEIGLDSIQIQFMDAKTFLEHTGSGWLDDEQEAYTLKLVDGRFGNSATVFELNNENTLTISVGSFYTGNDPVGGRDLGIGGFDKKNHENYPTYFREDGTGASADRALSLYLGSATEYLYQFKVGEGEAKGKDGSKVKAIAVNKSADTIWDMDGWYLNPPIFSFTE